MKQLKLMLTAIIAVFGLFAFRTQPAQGGKFNFRRIFAALCLSAILGISAVPGIGNIASAEDDLSRVPGTGHYGNTIHGAAMKGLDIWVRHFLILNKDDLNAKAENSRTPLHIAARHNKIESVTELLKWGADVEVRERYGKTPLHFAAAFSDPNIIRALIKARANIDAKDNYDSTPLHFAGGFGSPDVAKVLIEAGAEIDAKDRDGRTPLFWAAQEVRAGVVAALVKAGADINAKDNDGRTPLQWAVHEGKPEVAGVLYKAGANNDFVNAVPRYSDRFTHLHWAIEGIPNHTFGDGYWAMRGSKKERDNRVATLINAGADIERKAILAYTPLHVAALRRNVEAVRLLIEAGADPHAISETYASSHEYGGEKPIDMARRSGSREAEDLLWHYMERLAREEREKREKAVFDARVKKWEEWAAKARVPEIEKKWAYCHYVQLHPGFLCFLWSFGW